MIKDCTLEDFEKSSVRFELRLVIEFLRVDFFLLDLVEVSSAIPRIFLCWAKTLGGRPSRIQLCIRASSGVILCSGSQMNHPLKNRMKEFSDHLSTLVKLLVFGLLNLPLELGFKAGWLLSSKKRLFLVACSRMYSSGTPQISIIRPSWSISLSPAKMGYPQKSSARMHPQLHISMLGV